jgi:uncharacterized protein YcfJ
MSSMMNGMKLTAFAAAVAMTGVSSLAQADQYGGDDGRYYDRRQETAEVLRAEPIYQNVRINEPRQQCYQQEVRYNDGYYDNSGSFVGTILGGIVGGVVGHQFGRGGGRFAATAIGAAVGAGAGNAVGSRNDGYYGGERVGYQQRCDVVNEVHYEQRPSGYDVTYRYHGAIYHTQTQYDPGERIPVNVSVTPAGY